MSRLSNNFFAGEEQRRQAAPRNERISAHRALDEDPDDVSVPEGPGSTFGRRSARTMAPSAGPGPMPGQGRPAVMEGGFGRPTGPSASAQPAHAAPSYAAPKQAPPPPVPLGGRAAAAAARRMEELTIEGSDSEEGSPPPKAAAGYRQPAPPAMGAAAARPRPPAMQPGPPPSVGAPRSSGLGHGRGVAPGAGLRNGGAPARGAELLVEEVGDLSFEDEDGQGMKARPAAMQAGPARGTGGLAAKVPAGTPLPQDHARSIRQLLWGGQGGPPPSWQQGLFFCARPGLRFGLVQRQGGPCGVLAAVQAHVLANLRAQAGPGLFNTDPSRAEQHEALAAGITDLLWQARMGPSAYVAVPPGGHGTGGGSLTYDQLARSVAVLGADSRQGLLSAVTAALPAYLDEEGWGVVLLMYGLAASRGVENVRADMDEPNNALMGMHGYCTQELVNLILTGEAVSNVFDGHRALDGDLQLKGVTRRCRLGLLTLFEWYKYVEVGACLKSPELPVWVVCSESHFTVLFSQDQRPLRDALPFDLLYYDELANQESLLRLTIRPDPAGGWTARVGDSMGDRGKYEGHNIPPLECVIETKWPGVSVDWNGAEPFL